MESKGLLSARHLPELDGVRGVACGSIVTLHCLMGPADPSILLSLRTAIAPLVAGGVDLFFVLSGFLIVGILMDHRGTANYFTVFWSRRILGIFPVYFLLLATYLIALGIDKAAHPAAFDAWLFNKTLPTWSYFFFVQNYFMATTYHVGSYWIGITWSLAIEEQFYLIIPLLIYLLNRRRVIWLAGACVFLAPIIRCLPGASFNWTDFFTLSRIDALVV